MANIREISGRIRSIQDTMKITNAMYMISSTKLRKAKKSEEGNGPYFTSLQEMVAHIMNNLPDTGNPLLDLRPEKKGKDRTRGILVVTADKGLAGSYNHNVLKEAERLISEDSQVKLYVVGEVGRQYFAGKKIPLEGQFKYTAQNPSLHRARVIAKTILDEFEAGNLDDVFLVYTRMETPITSATDAMRLLPLTKEDVNQRLQTVDDSITGELEFYPSPGEVLSNIIPNVLVGYIYSALVEAFCSEQNDRMMAMEAANRNAQQMIHDLSIEYNRVRQAMITQEITEVIAGAKAQKKKKMKRRQMQLAQEKE